jgi:acyl-CoA synthetase (AMP-forming)/AMP-acid ligase II
VWEAVADRFPDAPAALHGDVELDWRTFDRRADGIAATLVAHGLKRQDKVAQYMRNRPEYLESMFAAFKAGLVPANTNFRYTEDELTYLWNDSDAKAIVFEDEFTEMCERVRARVPQVDCWIQVGGAERCPPWAVAYDEAASSARDRMIPSWGRSGDDLYLLYTGGTTGMPKGVMWQQDELFRMLHKQEGRPVPDDVDAAALVAGLERPGPRVLPAAPLMHGTAAWFTMPVLARGGAAVTVTGASLDAEQLLDAIVKHTVTGVSIVGDAFALPLIAALDSQPGRWNLDRLRVIVSSGAILSSASKHRLLDHAPNVVVVDTLGSSESGSLARSITTNTDDSAAESTRFRLGPDTRVIAEDGHDVEAGSGQQGLLAIGGHQPIGYYKDPLKTAATFREISGRRYVVAGDHAIVDADGTITLLGRGSGCINTAGEKVYPEEIEQVLKTADGVDDAAVVGVADERFGEIVVALVQPSGGRVLDPETLRAHVKGRLAAYKAPKRVVLVESVLRGANGKLDYRRLKELVATGSIDTGNPD